MLTKNAKFATALLTALFAAVPSSAAFDPLDGFPYMYSNPPEMEAPVETESPQVVGLLSTDRFEDTPEVSEWFDRYADEEGLIDIDEALPWMEPKPRYAGNGDRRVLLRNQIAKLGTPAQMRRVLDFITKSSSACSQFVGSVGPGAVGNKILSEAADFDLLMRGTTDMKKVCPKYPSMSVEDQKRAWMMVLATMAFLESSCRSDQTATGPNGTLRGLFQLHAGKEGQYTKSRRCTNGSSKTNDGSVLCTLGMLDDQLARSSALFSRDSYWGVLRPQGEPHPKRKGQRIAKSRIIQDTLMALPFCH